MTRRIRSDSNPTHQFSKYLKPGALARLRDSRISARSTVLSHRFNSSSNSPARSPSPPQTAISGGGGGGGNGGGVGGAQIEFLPDFPGLGCGPRCFGRKKLVAAKVVAAAFASAVGAVSDPNNESFISGVNLLVH